MAPWWPGTALLFSTKAPRKLVFLFTLSLSVTYLFYSLLSCYSSLQFPLQDTGVFLQSEPGVSPAGTIRTASLKPETSSRVIPLVPRAGIAQRTILRTTERTRNNNSTAPQSSNIGISNISQQAPSVQPGTEFGNAIRSKGSLIKPDLGIRTKNTSAGASTSAPTTLGTSSNSKSKDTNTDPSASLLHFNPSFRRSRTDLSHEPRFSVSSTVGTSAASKSSDVVLSAVQSTSDSASIPATGTSDSVPSNKVTLKSATIRSSDSVPFPTSEEKISTSDKAPHPPSSVNISTSDSGSVLSTKDSAPVPSTSDSAPVLSTKDSAPIPSSAEGAGNQESSHSKSTEQEISTSDSVTIALSVSTLDSAPIPSPPLIVSTTDNVPQQSHLPAVGDLISSHYLSSERGNNDQDSISSSDSRSYTPDKAADFFLRPRSITVNSPSTPWQDFRAADSVSFPVSGNSYDRTTDFNSNPIKPSSGISASSFGETSGSHVSAGNETQSSLHSISYWDRTPLAATEMIPESHTGFYEREPQESSTTEEELNRRIPVNSTPEYGEKKLPQAIIIGVKKGGTRALLEALRAHPDVRAVGVEPHFFDRNYEKGLEWYRDLMPRTVDGQITMEKTPSYFVTNEAPQRIHSMAKDTKLIVVVRNPVTRAISDYTQTLSKKPEIPTFEVLAFKNRTLGLVDASWSALRIGIYALHLESWMQYFPLSQILFVSGERLITNPAEELAKVQEFLGLRRIITDKYFHFNKTKGFPCLKKPEDTGTPRCLGKSKGRTHPKIDPDVIHRLRKFYKPFNAMFYQMTGQDFQWEKDDLES
ncbi:uncharacterized protein WCC33_013360 [Rhinophrynus dorsalis]